MFEQREQKRAKFAPAILQVFELVLFNQPGEKLLGEVLRFGWRLALAANKSIDWPPVRPAQLFQRRLTIARIARARSHNNRPMRRREPISFASKSSGPHNAPASIIKPFSS